MVKLLVSTTTEIFAILFFSFMISFHGLQELGKQFEKETFVDYKGQKISVQYPEGFQLSKKTQESGYCDGKKTVWSAIYRTAEGQFEFSIESQNPGFDTGNTVADKTVINGNEFERVYKLDNDSNTVFGYYRPIHKSATYDHIQATFPKKNSSYYKKLFEQTVQTLVVHDF